MDENYQSPEPMADAPAEEQTGTEQETALLPKSIFGQKDVQVGGECTFRVVHVYDDEVEVEYVKSEHKEPSGQSAADEADSAIDQMANEA